MQNVQDTLKQIMNKRKLNHRFSEVMQQVYKNPDVIEFCQKNKEQLSQHAIEIGSSKLYEFVTEKNKLKNHQNNLMPGYEPKLVLSNHLIDIEYIPTKENISETKEKKRAKLVRSISMPKSLKNASLDNFYREPQREEALDLVLKFLEQYMDNPHTFVKGVYLAGSFGVGKTYLMGAMANTLADNGFETTIIHFPSFAVELRNSIGKLNNDVSAKIDAIKKSPVLVIDDIGADNISSWLRDDVLGVILEYRMQEELPTFFTSNFSMEQLEEEHLTINQRGEAEPLKAKRLMQRIQFLSQQVMITGKNHRFD